MNKIFELSLLVGLLFLSGCAISHTYGPYMGKVVDKETEEPIEGAVVFLQFDTTEGSIGGLVHHYADAVETLTDSKGEFIIHPYTVNTFRILNGWETDAYAIVFKPGYGVFPQNRKTKVTPKAEPDWTIPANMPMVIELPKLATKKERLESLDDAGGWNRDMSCEKQRIILRLYNSERAYLGLSSATNMCRGDGHEN